VKKAKGGLRKNLAEYLLAKYYPRKKKVSGGSGMKEIAGKVKACIEELNKE